MKKKQASEVVLFGGSLLLGLFVGSLFVSFCLPKRSAESLSKATRSTKTEHSRGPYFLSVSHPARQEINSLQKSSHYSTSTAALLREARSPLRVDSLMSFQMEEETFDDWIQRLADGEIERPEEFTAIGKWLAQKDPQRALESFFQYKPDFDTIDNLVAYRDAIFGQLVRSDQAQLVFEGLQNMKRGGAQQANTLYFSDLLAKTHPCLLYTSDAADE